MGSFKKLLLQLVCRSWAVKSVFALHLRIRELSLEEYQMNRRQSLKAISSLITVPWLLTMDLVRAEPYQLPNTNVYDLPDPISKRKYQIWEDTPVSYQTSQKKYPVLFVTDAPYAFPLIRSIRNRLGQGGQNIEDFILVGLAPTVDESPTIVRSRDYTPSNPFKNVLYDPSQKLYSNGLTYGEAAEYRDYVEQQVLPFIAKVYRADMLRTTYAGHSYGGLLGAFILLTKPLMFNKYILGSPSLWFDQKFIFQLESTYAKTHKDLPAQVMMYTGSYETIRPEPRYYKTNDMVKDMVAFEHLLKSRHYPSLKIGSKVLQDEDHFSVFPSLISRGLIWALPGHGPYISG